MLAKCSVCRQLIDLVKHWHNDYAPVALYFCDNCGTTTHVTKKCIRVIASSGKIEQTKKLKEDV